MCRKCYHETLRQRDCKRGHSPEKRGANGRCGECDRTLAVENHRKWRYGMERGGFEAIIAAQGGGCAICGSPFTAKGRSHCLDHDHETGRVRGVLCYNCNIGLGGFKDSIIRLLRAIGYLNETSKKLVPDAA